MKKIVLIFLFASSISNSAHAFFWCDDYVSGIQVGAIDNHIGGGIYSQCYIGTSFFLPQNARGTYMNDAGIKSAPINISPLGIGYDFNEMVFDSSASLEFFHPYVKIMGDMTFLFTNAPKDSDIGFGYTAAAGADYRFDRFVLGVEFNHNYVNYLEYQSHHSQNYLLTLGITL